MTDNMEYIASEFPFSSHFVKVLGSKLHYIDEGTGNPLVFIHDMPTSSYLWRNIIPGLKDVGRCIALDLIGMGKSDKPDISYRVFEHIEYFDHFIAALDLKNITLVMQGWGSVIGFDYARRHSHNVKGLAFIESYLRPPTTSHMVSLPIREIFEFRYADDGGFERIMHDNFLIENALQCAVIRALTAQELANYRAPFQDSASRKLLWQYLQDVPLGKHQDYEVVKLITHYSDWLQNTQIPKLLMYAVPGLMTTIETVQWAKNHLPNLQLADLGEALHYPQEDNPQVVIAALRDWLLHLKQGGNAHKVAENTKVSTVE